MNLSLIVLLSGGILWTAYLTYGRFLGRLLGLDPSSKTPAHTSRDDVDYVPGKPSVVLGHHFASIAGAGPIVGPVIAVAFGWIPAVLWILIGGIFFGAVHDLASLTASLRHQGRSIGELIQRYIGLSGKRLFAAFAFATLILVIAVFLDVVAKTFVSVPAAGSSSLMFILFAVIFGFLSRSGKISFGLLSAFGVGAMILLTWLGTVFPLELSYGQWIVLLFIYCFIAAITPVNLLLQPRDYLNSFLLYGMLLLGILGILVGQPSIQMESAVTLSVPGLGTIFPVLFVTIACGAISGFHSLVASGTTSKQIDTEPDALKVGYGGMLIESLLAIIAVGTVAILAKEDYSTTLSLSGPVAMFSSGLGTFISVLGIPTDVAVSFVALAVSAFAVTTLDTCTRLSRFLLQETASEWKESPVASVAGNRYVATLLVVLVSGLLLSTGQFQDLWPIFGSANQLLAALALLAVTAWLVTLGVKRRFTLIPMVFMFAVTLTSLALMVYTQFSGGGYLLMSVSIVLLIMALALIALSWRFLSPGTASASSGGDSGNSGAVYRSGSAGDVGTVKETGTADVLSEGSKGRFESKNTLR